MENKIEIAKKVLSDELEHLKVVGGFVSEAPSKFIGVSLKEEIERWSDDVIQTEIKIEALKLYILDEEGKSQQAAEYDKTHSICCDALLIENGGRCSACGRGV